METWICKTKPKPILASTPATVEDKRILIIDPPRLGDTFLETAAVLFEIKHMK